MIVESLDEAQSAFINYIGFVNFPEGLNTQGWKRLFYQIKGPNFVMYETN